MITLVFCVVALATKVASEGCHFGYVGEYGVDHWGDEYNECLGKHQSPINIDSKHVTLAEFPPFKMTGFDFTSAASITNNGHTAMMTIDSDTKPTLSGGPLGGIYEFAELHFHWGNEDSCGGENKINDKQYPLEMHMVFFKKEYCDSNSELGHQDGLCVLGTLFEIETNDNRNFNELVNALGNIIDVNDNAKFDSPPTLHQLLPRDLSSYFTYNGSLTTPPCSEAVIWVDFDNTVKISEKQLQAFRDLTDSDCNKLVNNFRAIQPLGDRTVLYHKAEKDDRYLLRRAKKIINIVADKILDIYTLLKKTVQW